MCIHRDHRTCVARIYNKQSVACSVFVETKSEREKTKTKTETRNQKKKNTSSQPAAGNEKSEESLESKYIYPIYIYIFLAC